MLCTWHYSPTFHSEKQDQNHKHHAQELQVSCWTGRQMRVRISHVIVFAKVFCQSALQSGVHHYGIIDEIWKRSVKYQTSPNHSVLSCSIHIKTPQTSVATKPQIDSQSWSASHSFDSCDKHASIKGPKCSIQKLQSQGLCTYKSGRT